MMPKNESWIEERLQNCAKQYPTVNVAAVARLKNLLEGKGHERSLTQGELVSMATQLMQDMVKPQAPTN